MDKIYLKRHYAKFLTPKSGRDIFVRPRFKFSLINGFESKISWILHIIFDSHSILANHEQFANF
ncbi:hypothetical protein Mgra_00001689 [Meloidogyne graminicola]|uniref:Uncharacterized protein n=1 Tax=Meloidogyne graminicola TaxID=189291 RepID=A0A8T0A016_9BILA|nr:hypothetical protein Mgra_00001689 [Meloidogyne graminicola]